ncbi:MAG: OmpA family protein [Devosia sp.]
MIRDFLKWVVPGLVTVLAGSSLCLAMTTTDIASAVADQSQATVQRAGFDWAELSFEVRDLTLSGTTTDQNYVDAARQRLARVPGVRSVTTHVTLAPKASPYRLSATLADGKIALAGGVPDETTRQLLLARAGVEQGNLELRSGMPERRVWVAGAQYAIDQLRYLDQGESTISDLRVDLSGRARSARDFRDLLIVLRAGAPAGVTLGEVKITPALVSPYQWNARSDGHRIEVSGFVPDDSLVDRYRAADTGGLAIATGLALGSGEPAGFADLSQKLVEQLSQLEYGTASIVDGQSTLTGAPPTAEIAQAVTQQLQSSGSIVVLEPPRIDDYWASATLHDGGTVVFDGYAPDAATRDALQQHQGADTQWLKLGRGAPEHYQSAMEFGLAALQRLSEGRFALHQQALTLSGVARSGDDYRALLDILAQDAPQGFGVSSAEISAPVAAAYQWSAVKAPSGAITLSGMVPNPDVEASLLSAAGQGAAASLTYAAGEPRNFLDAATTGLGLLSWLSDGKIVFDGSGWTITGSANSTIDKGALETDFATRHLAAAGWSMAIAGPAPAAAPAAPAAATAVAAPQVTTSQSYSWSASKLLTGAVTLSGQMPGELRLRIGSLPAGAPLIDQTVAAADAPAGFAQDVTAAMAAMSNVAEGFASFDGAQWRIDGNLMQADGQAAVEQALADAATPASAWHLTLLPPEPLAEAGASGIAEPVTPATPAPAAPAIAATVPTPQPEVVAPNLPPQEPQFQKPAPQAAPTQLVDTDYAFSASLSADGAVILSGQVPSDAALQTLSTMANGDTAALSIADGAPPGFLASAQIGLRALLQLKSGQLDFAAGAWRLTGVADDTAGRDAVLAATAADAAADWSVSVEAPAAVAAALPESAPATDQPRAKVDISACVGPVTDFSGRNAILFQSGAALITAESGTALDELVTDLKLCPDAVIHVEGHTDADGDAQQNLGLSVARAEAVVSALAEKGIDPRRLYAVGYGESSPIADNATADGKRQNRRIVVTVTNAHY